MGSSKKETLVAKKSVTKTSTVKKSAVKKVTANKTAVKKPVVKKKTVKRSHQADHDLELLTLHLHHEAPQLDPIVPRLPAMPEPPAPVELGICKHCHLLPAAAFELVVVMSCLMFSLSAVLLTSTQTIELQRDVIATLQQVKTDVYVRR